MPFDIIEGLELPARDRPRKYNIDELEIGQALVIPEGTKFTESAIYSAARKLGYSVSIVPYANPETGTNDKAVLRVETRAPRAKKAK